MKHICLFYFLLISFILGAQDLENTWYLYSININGEDISHNAYESYNPTIYFDSTNNTYGGLVCNDYNGNFTLNSSSEIVLTSFVQTLIMCVNDPINDGFEYQYFYDVLYAIETGDTGSILSYNITGDGDEATLVITNTSNSNYAVYGTQPLANPVFGDWYLNYIINNNEQIINNYEINLNLTNSIGPYGSFVQNGQSSCNNYEGFYYPTETLFTILTEATTDFDCSPSEENDYEMLYLNTLSSGMENVPKTFNYQIIDDLATSVLILSDENNNQLVYTNGPNTPTIFGRWNLTALETNGQYLSTPESMVSNIDFSTTQSNGTFDFYGDGGFCNGINGQFSSNDNGSITVSDVGITLLDCGTGELNDFENLYFSILSSDNPNDFSISFTEDGLSLILEKINGDKLFFARESLTINEFETSLLSISLVENPVVNTLLFNVPTSFMAHIKGVIIGIDGKEILSFEGLSESLDVSYLNSGVYFIELNDRLNNSRKTLKFIKK